MEKHRSREYLPSESGPQRGRANVPHSVPAAAVVSRRPTTVSQRNPFTGHSVCVSAHPPVHLNSDNPYPATSPPQIQVLESRGTGDPSSRQSSPSAYHTNLRLSSSTLVAQRTHDVPGEVWIDPLEREGLPFHAPVTSAGNREETSTPLRRRSTRGRGSRDDGAIVGGKHIERLAEHQAAGVVRAHTRRGWGWLYRSHNDKRTSKSRNTQVDLRHEGTDEKGKATKHTPSRRHTHSDMENDTDFTDAEFHRPGRVRKGVPGSWLAPVMHLPHMHTQHHPDHNHRGPSHGPKLGNGVLSALLALYGHDHEHDDESSASGASTPPSRTSSDAGSEDGILPKPDRPWLSNQDDDHGHSEGRKAGQDKHPGKSGLGCSLKTGSASSILAHLCAPSLPAASTTAALIAGAGTLSGAAAPQQVTLAPDLKRPGYNLVRYSVEEVPKYIASRGHKSTRSADPSTASADKERDSGPDSPDTPGATIVGSPTAGSEGLADKLKGSHDHLVSTPGGRKGWTDRLKDLPLSMHLSPAHIRASHPSVEKGLHTPSGSGTPGSAGGTPVDEFIEKKEYFDLKHIEKEARRVKEQERKEWKEREKQREKEIRRKRRKAEVYVRCPSSSVPRVD